MGSPANQCMRVLTRLLRGIALQISPPFVITEAEIGRIAEVYGDALSSVG
jgi:adenosylmethionine-8-amino-7-oxononanoate aminotransferase